MADPESFFASPDEAPPLFSDGSVQSYAIPLRPRGGINRSAGPRMRLSANGRTHPLRCRERAMEEVR